MKVDYKSKQLGMTYGTASHRLRRAIMFKLVQTCGMNMCFRCGTQMTAENFSIEHKEPWLHISAELFWDLNNIAFSHCSCNYKVARKVKGPQVDHGHEAMYKRGCRCRLCKEFKSIENKKRVRGRVAAGAAIGL